MIELVLNKLGVVIAKPEQRSQFQCVAQALGLYHYECMITFINPKLNSKGWTVDHIEVDHLIQQYFDQDNIPSCERMVIGAAEMIAREVEKINMPAASVYVRISNIPSGSQGFFEATWVNAH